MKKYLVAGEACKKCGTERVEITIETLRRIITELRPVIHSIPASKITEDRPIYAICPRCDAYSLGIEMVKGYPFKDKNGLDLNIKDIEDTLW